MSNFRRVLLTTTMAVGFAVVFAPTLSAQEPPTEAAPPVQTVPPPTPTPEPLPPPAAPAAPTPPVARGVAPPAEPAPEDEIIVTGSRIPRANVTAPTAVTTVTAETIELSGLVNVAEILRATPSFGVSGLSTSSSNFLTTAAGVNTLELRNLDEDRTLVLVNGRRYVSGVAGSSAVDFNTIPVDLIDRVEVITGGASAIYGSDALAGVINVILRNDFEGVEARYQYGQSDEADDVTHRANLQLGGNFADGRGNAVLSVTWSKEEGVFARDRSETAVDDIAECVLTDEPGTCQTSFAPFFSSYSPRGRFFVPSTGESFTLSEGVGPGGTVVPWSTTEFGFNRQQFRTISVPIERYLIAGSANYEFTPNVRAFLETTYAFTEAQSTQEPFPFGYEDAEISGIPVDNPFVPQAIREAVLAAGDDTVEFFRRMSEVGNRGALARRDTFRIVAGLEGEVADTFEWELFYNYGQTTDDQQGGGQVNTPNFREAINVVEENGELVCANPAARAEGCVPINIFGLGSISPAAANYIRAPTQRQQFVRQEQIVGTFGGPLFALPAGDVSFVVGAEWRRESAEDVPDALTQSGQNAGNVEQPTFGSFNATELFVEVEAPLLRDAPFAEELTVGAAFRYADYSTVGETEAYTARVSWAPIEPLRFRAQYARAVRAPNVTELFAPGGENFAPVADPCQGVTATDVPGVVDDNCRSIPAIAARIAATGAFNLTQTEIQGTGGFTSRGNPNLSPETSDSFTVGAVFDQELGRNGRATLSVDYFTIEIEDLIDVIERQASLDQCFQAADFPNVFCAAVVRDLDGPAFQLGEITEVNSGFINEGTLQTSGIDVSALYALDLEQAFGWRGELQLRANYTYLIDFETERFGLTDEDKGEVGFPEHEWQAAALYRMGPFTAQWQTNYIGESVVDVDPESLFNFTIDPYVTHDVQLSWDVTEQANLYVGVNNAFDEDAPVILSGVPGNTTGTDTNAEVYDPIGRTFYAGARLRF